MGYLVFIEGSIGSGKSTTLHRIQELCKGDPTIVVMQEGIEQWLQVKDNSGNILDHFYKDKAKYSFVLQMVILVQRHFHIKSVVEELQKKHKDFIVIAERSPASCDRVFRQILPLTDLEHASFDFIYKKLEEDQQNMGVSVNYIYIDTPADICMERIKKRARPEESVIDLQYLQELEHMYQVLKQQSHVINGMMSTEYIANQIATIMTEIVMTDIHS